MLFCIHHCQLVILNLHDFGFGIMRGKLEMTNECDKGRSSNLCLILFDLCCIRDLISKGV